MLSRLITLSWTCVGAGLASALFVTVDILRGRRQRMRIMNVVWPITALWAGPLGLWVYFSFGRAARAPAGPAGGESKPRFPVQVAKGATHCGSGCAIGDVVAELVFLALPFSIFGHRLFAAWVYEYVAAFGVGILFQYLTIKPMRKVSSGEALKDAIKADALSLTAWQVGMYGWMAIATFVIFHHELRPTSVVFWFVMQVGMLAGFATSYPVNWALLRTGIKQSM